MSYSTVTDALIGLIEQAEGFDGNVTEGDYLPLDAGVMRAAIVKLASMTQERVAFKGQWTRMWNYTVEVFSAHMGDIANTRNAQRTDRQNFLDKLAAYPELDGEDIFVAGVSSIAIEDQLRQFGDASYLMEALSVTVQEDFDASEEE